MIAIVGSWINAQGDWVKDFAYIKSVDIPLFAWNFSVSGIVWYEVGIFDDLLGVTLMITGLTMFRKFSEIDISVFRNYLYFIPFLSGYLALDLIVFLIYRTYYVGVISLSLYGEVWNTILYFGMMPLLLISCLIIIGADRESFNSNKEGHEKRHVFSNIFSQRYHH